MQTLVNEGKLAWSLHWNAAPNGIGMTPNDLRWEVLHILLLALVFCYFAIEKNIKIMVELYHFMLFVIVTAAIVVFHAYRYYISCNLNFTKKKEHHYVRYCFRYCYYFYKCQYYVEHIIAGTTNIQYELWVRF